MYMRQPSATDNRLRVLSEVVSLDAWHAPFDVNTNEAAVYVELSFHEGRLGGDFEDFPFTFKLSLKRAKLTVSMDFPLVIVKSSIARSVPAMQTEHTQIRTVRDSLHANLQAGGSLSLSDFHAALSGSASTGFERKRENEIRVVQTIPPILVSNEAKGDRCYSWLVESTFLNSLIGQPWDPVEQPRFVARHGTTDHAIEPVIKAELSCALEDLVISDIRPKDESLALLLQGRAPNDSRTLVAQQHLSCVLRHASLEPGKMDNRFSDLLIGSVIAIQQANYNE